MARLLKHLGKTCYAELSNGEKFFVLIISVSYGPSVLYPLLALAPGGRRVSLHPEELTE